MHLFMPPVRAAHLTLQLEPGRPLSSAFKVQDVTCKLVVLKHAMEPKGRVAGSF